MKNFRERRFADFKKPRALFPKIFSELSEEESNVFVVIFPFSSNNLEPIAYTVKW